MHNTDISASIADHNDNRCDADASLSDRFRYFYHRKVQRFFPSSFPSLSLMTMNPKISNSSVSKLRWNKTPCNQMEVTVDTLYERHEMSRMSNHDAHINTREQPCDKAPV
jgi:hypothetical protein